jgi:hypothetical protein
MQVLSVLSVYEIEGAVTWVQSRCSCSGAVLLGAPAAGLPATGGRGAALQLLAPGQDGLPAIVAYVVWGHVAQDFVARRLARDSSV